MQNILECTEEDLERPLSEPEKMAAKVIEMFDGKNPVRTLDVANATGRNYARGQDACTAPASAVF